MRTFAEFMAEKEAQVDEGIFFGPKLRSIGERAPRDWTQEMANHFDRAYMSWDDNTKRTFKITYAKTGNLLKAYKEAAQVHQFASTSQTGQAMRKISKTLPAQELSPDAVRRGFPDAHAFATTEPGQPAFAGKMPINRPLPPDEDYLGPNNPLRKR
jgi:hypothetical protein